MKRLIEQFHSELAGEYVLGTLRGAARRRFEHLLRREASCREAVQEWEAIMTRISLTVPAIEPPARVWQAIEARIQPATASRRSGFGWRWLAVALVLIAVVVPVSYNVVHRASAPLYVANLDEGQAAAVVVRIDHEDHLSIDIKTHRQIAANQSLELWLLPPGQAKPVSLGVIKGAGRPAAVIPAALRNEVNPKAKLAVSLEPSGGSPTGLPTGPVLWVGVVQAAG